MASKKQQAKIDAVAATEAALTDVQRGFHAKKAEERQRYETAIDSEFWIAVCFETRGHKEEFLRKLDLAGIGDKYLDGRAVAKKLGIQLDTPSAKLGRPARSQGSLNKLVRR
jgi:hypothetical protein